MKLDTRVLYLGHGRAGLLCCNKLCDEIGVLPVNILAYTYRMEDNNALIRELDRRGVGYSVASIKELDTWTRIRAFQPDVIISMHYRHLVPASILGLASIGAFNLHPSLLPKYRGTFSAPWAIINGETRTGITYHFMNENFDDGQIILQRSLPILKTDTGHSLFNKLIDLGVAHFCDAFEAVVIDRVPGSPQEGEPSYYARRLPFDGIIDRSWDEQTVERFIKALTFPGKPGPMLRKGEELVEVRNMQHYWELCS